jgi:outer membrane protein assembly factor BamB
VVRSDLGDDGREPQALVATGETMKPPFRYCEVRRALAFLALFTLASACGKSPAPAPPAASLPPIAPLPPASSTVEAPEKPQPPLVVEGMEWEPETGNALGKPSRPGWPKMARENPQYPAPEISFDKGAVVRKGAISWRTPLQGYLGTVRPPDRVISGDRVVVVAEHRLVGLDANTGAQVWTADATTDRLFAEGDLVFSTDCQSPSAAPKHRWLEAHRLSDGKLAWKIELPSRIDPDAIYKIGSLYAVGGRDYVALFDAAGTRHIELDEHVIVAEPIGSDVIVATDKRIARLGPRGETRWDLKKIKDTFVGAGGFVTLPGGDMLLFAYGAISDSGVELVRFRPDDGKELYRVQKHGAGVGHSEYEHTAWVRLRNGRLEIVSHGSYATRIETASPETGTTLKRWTPRKTQSGF